MTNLRAPHDSSVALVIEDDPASQRMLMRALREVPLSPIGFGSAEAAIAWIEMNGAPAFVSVDVCLPRMSGHQLCAWLRANTRDVRIAVVTARATVDDEARAIEIEAAFVSKPVRMRAYTAIVRSLFAAPEAPDPQADVARSPHPHP